MKTPPTLLIHGGAGTIQPGADRAPYLAALQAVLEAGARDLDAGMGAVDVVTRAVALLEECPLFNAGVGAVLNAKGEHELDAAVMCGASGRFGAVAGVRRTRQPVYAAHRLLHANAGAPVLLQGEAADAWALAQGLDSVPPEHFSTAARRAQFVAWQASAQASTGSSAGRMWQDHEGEGRVAHPHPDPAPSGWPSSLTPIDEYTKHGTVGAVALDAQGRLAAATSTGGMTGKWPGRVGDSPVPGAGTWADARVAVSCTGQGEAFLRAAAAHSLAARMRWAGQSLAEAAQAVLHEDVARAGGEGGLIALDAAGRFALPFSTTGMYRGGVRVGEAPWAAVFGDEAASVVNGTT